MSLEPDQAGAQSHSHSQCQAHPIPLYESDNYIYYVEGTLKYDLISRILTCIQKVGKKPEIHAKI
jgi:hypothetical protein